MSKIPLFRPHFTSKEYSAVAETLASGWVGLGPRVQEFEERFAASVGARYGVATNSCTAALQLAIKSIGGVRGKYEIIVPSLTFVSTAHAARHCGYNVRFGDVCAGTLRLNRDAVAEMVTDHTAAVIVVQYGGNPYDPWLAWEHWCDIDVPLIYDCAHAAGSNFNASGKLCCWSFHAVKNLSCGDGGMLTTDDEDVADRARRLRWLGIDRSTWERDCGGYAWKYDCAEIGIKGHMNDIAASIGLVQLERLPEMQARRTEIAQRYHARLKGTVEVPDLLEGHGWHLFVIRCTARDQLHVFLREQGITTSVHYQPIHTHACYLVHGEQPHLPVTEAVASHILSLPMFPEMTDQQVDDVCRAIEDFHA